MVEIKNKYKQQQKLLNKQQKQMENMKQTINSLEQEKLYMQKEIQTFHRDDSESELSENVKDQYKNLIDTIHEKNKQMSQLLDDIEVSLYICTCLESSIFF